VTALALAGCTAVARTPATTTVPKVLGEQRGTPTVIGQPAPAGTGELGAVSCADATHCWAVGVAGPNAAASPTLPVTVIAATTDGGRTWSTQQVTLPAIPDLSGVSCPAITTCMAVGATGAQPSAGLALITDDGGATWAAAATAPPGSVDLTAVTCASTTACTAIVSDGTAIWSAQTADFGTTWVRKGNLPLAFEDPRTISCTPAGTCLVAGYSSTTTGHGEADIALSLDGGQTWAPATIPPGTGALESATCVTATDCLAVGSTSTTVSDVVPAQGLVLASTDGGHTWTAASAPPVDDAFGVACPSTLVCALVGTEWTGQPPVGTGAVAVSTDGGLSFTGSKVAYVPLSLTALSCPAPSACVAVGGDVVARMVLPVPKVHHPKKEPAGTGHHH
jgi:hypothetical protein